MRKGWVLVGSAVLAVAGLAVPGRAATPAATCTDWPVTLGARGVNAGGPDTNANYWVTHYEGPAGASLLVRGAYPAARFFSFAVQDTSGTTLGSLRDDRLAPDAGSRNPFTVRMRWTGKDSYTAHVDFGTAPAQPAPNTVYAGQTLDGQPNVAGTLIYRLYVPTDQQDPQGGVPLPRLWLRTPGGDVPLTLTRPCAALPPNASGPTDPVVDGASQPDQAPAPQPRNKAYADPNFVRVWAGQLYEPVTNSLPEQAAALVPQRKGIPLQNTDFPYLMSSITRADGHAVVVRFEPATFPDTVDGRSVVGHFQTRYWSVCTFSDTTEGGLRTYGCWPDWLTPAGPDGLVRILVTDAAHRPAHLPASVHWLDWGPTSEDLVFFRVGVPATWWPADPDHIDQSAPDQAAAAFRTMGAYYPLARYCPAVPTTLVAFDACVAHGFGSGTTG